MESFKDWIKEGKANPYKKEKALDLIVKHTDASNDEEAEEELMDMMNKGNMDIDDVIQYLERG